MKLLGISLARNFVEKKKKKDYNTKVTMKAWKLLVNYIQGIG